MRNTRKSKWSVFFTILTVVFLFLSIYLSSDILGRTINVFAVLIMTAIIHWGFGSITLCKTGIFCLIDITNDLKLAANKIQELAQNPDINIEREFFQCTTKRFIPVLTSLT